jgi:hypothetical protein
MCALPEVPDRLHYVESDLPPGFTIADYRASRAQRQCAPRHQGPIRRLAAALRRLNPRGGGAAPSSAVDPPEVALSAGRPRGAGPVRGTESA